MGQPTRPLPADGATAGLAPPVATGDAVTPRTAGGRVPRATWRAHAPLWLMCAPASALFAALVLAPLLVSVVVRAFGWSMLLNTSGLVNQALGLAGLGPYKLEYTTFAIVIALVHVMLPFMVIPVWTALQRLDPQTEHAALSLGASPFTTLRRIVVPQLMPGVLSGSLMVFGLSASAFAIPGLLGGRRLKVAATAVYDEFLGSLNWPLGATIAVLLLIANLVVMLTYYRVLERRYARSLGGASR